MERTFVMIKPDGVQRGFIGRIVSRFEDKGLKIAAMKFMRIPRETAEEHYAEHVGKPFYGKLMDYITSGPVVAMVMEGKNAVAVCRSMMGKTNPQEATPGTIRADFGMVVGRNVTHGSDSLESAAREIGIFFEPGEIVEWEKCDDVWIYE